MGMFCLFLTTFICKWDEKDACILIILLVIDLEINICILCIHLIIRIIRFIIFVMFWYYFMYWIFSCFFYEHNFLLLSFVSIFCSCLQHSQHRPCSWTDLRMCHLCLISIIINIKEQVHGFVILFMNNSLLLLNLMKLFLVKLIQKYYHYYLLPFATFTNATTILLYLLYIALRSSTNLFSWSSAQQSISTPNIPEDAM
jgi:hypothetical protein